ncbi:hypothetical protein ACH5RR_029124 [Cinchona calisaya]|uniref:Reverse transcriptase zinc-binding domain-containing protein n=1 Tax=Cinchona calisaya TaxID=153742 RepID=A0ABD2YS00_9GENT
MFRKVARSSHIPIKVSIFMWRILNDFLSFHHVLLSLGFNGPSKCYFCESYDYLLHGFLYWPLAARLWYALEANFGVPCISVGMIQHKFQAWNFASTLSADGIDNIIPIMALLKL